MRSFVLLLLAFGTLAAQDSATRAAEIEEARRKKAAAVKPETNTPLEDRLIHIKEGKVLERISAGIGGVRAKLGGLATGGGFAFGPEYLRRDLAGGRLMLRSAAQTSLRLFQQYDVHLLAPDLAGRRAYVDFYALHRNFPQLPYYGPGADSEKNDRSNFRLEDTDFDAAAGVRPFRHVTIGGSLGYLMVNTGPGTDDRYISTERKFAAAAVPGLARQTDFLRTTAFLQYDSRDIPGGARSGGVYAVQFRDYRDRELKRNDFQRLDIELQQFIPFFNQRRVIALRGETTLTWNRAGQSVPFYLQPTLGGSDDLRGFRPYRFYGDNRLAMNAEYRWEVFSGLDMALFADAGKVFQRRSQWDFSNLESAVGFGFRFNVRNNVFLRLDTGFSHEGFQVWFKFGPAFAASPIRQAGNPRVL